MPEILLNKESFEGLSSRFDSVFSRVLDASEYARKAETVHYVPFMPDMNLRYVKSEAADIQYVMRNIVSAFSTTDNELSKQARQIGEQYVGPGISSAIQDWIENGGPGIATAIDPNTIEGILTNGDGSGSSATGGLANFADKIRSMLSDEDIDSIASKIGKGSVKLLEHVSGTEVSPVIGSAIAGLVITLTEKSTYGEMKLGIQDSENFLASEYAEAANNGNLGGQILYGGLMFTQRASYNIVNTATNAVGSFVSGIGSPFKLAGKAANAILGEDNIVTKGLKGIGDGISKVGSWLKNLM